MKRTFRALSKEQHSKIEELSQNAKVYLSWELVSECLQEIRYAIDEDDFDWALEFDKEVNLEPDFSNREDFAEYIIRSCNAVERVLPVLHLICEILPTCAQLFSDNEDEEERLENEHRDALLFVKGLDEKFHLNLF